MREAKRMYAAVAVEEYKRKNSESNKIKSPEITNNQVKCFKALFLTRKR